MKRNHFTLTAAVSTFLIGGVLLAGCSTAVETPAVTSSVTAEISDASVELSLGPVATEVLAANANSTTTNDDEWTLDGAVSIALDGSTATADGDGVSVSGSTITITAAGTYVLSGQFDGQVVVDTDDEDVVALVLDSAEISSSTSAAIAVANAEDVVVSLSGTNSLSSTGDDADYNATLFSDADLTISGDGSLTVSSAVNDGITSHDDLVILSGDITVTAGDDGLRGKDSLTIEGGTVTVDAGGDALKSDNDEDETRGYVYIAGGTVALTAADDGVQAETDIVIAGGSTTLAAEDDGLKSEVNIVISGGGTAVTDSYEGIESYYITIEGGVLAVNASDDGINATSGTSTTTDIGGIVEADDGAMVSITGGETTVNSAGDGIDSNGSMLVTGGMTTVFGSSEDREGALDANGTIVVDGGTVLAVGMTFMATAPETSSSQGWVSASLEQAYGADQTVQVLDSSGTVVAEFTSIKSFQSVVLSDAAITNGDTYTITVDGDSAGTVTAGVAAAGSESGGGGGGAPRP
ncbi:carbohydrate-binding domain-containing protein [Salinibacterium sp. SWN248]|uniref:carbohydrate-binding domain-containing protein n=1 Tax=Salinibacterium sp. SWN248 TaxID=2792056 RepID=UPI0018CCFA99|nr:carbohydrate-binding domain-containing protein [Salinibacterium sp. SWN248]MBH0022524.1 carbohydrate-binding domain-containing protein [Salinibacterium sp. SWN248]